MSHISFRFLATCRSFCENRSQLFPVTIIIKTASNSLIKCIVKCCTELGPYGQMWYQIGSNEYQYQENAVTFVMKIIVYFYSMVKCGTNYVPVTIIIKVSKQFYSMVNSRTKLIPVTGVLKYRNNSIKPGA